MFVAALLLYGGVVRFNYPSFERYLNAFNGSSEEFAAFRCGRMEAGGKR